MPWKVKTRSRDAGPLESRSAFKMDGKQASKYRFRLDNKLGTINKLTVGLLKNVKCYLPLHNPWPRDGQHFLTVETILTVRSERKYNYQRAIEKKVFWLWHQQRSRPNKFSDYWVHDTLTFEDDQSGCSRLKFHRYWICVREHRSCAKDYPVRFWVGFGWVSDQHWNSGRFWLFCWWERGH